MHIMTNLQSITVAEQNQMLASGQLMTVRQLHETYGVPKITIYKWVDRGHLTAVRSGISIYVDPSEFVRCMNDRAKV